MVININKKTTEAIRNIEDKVDNEMSSSRQLSRLHLLGEIKIDMGNVNKAFIDEVCQKYRSKNPDYLFAAIEKEGTIEEYDFVCRKRER